MQIDFHHAVTYVACRLGGMNHELSSTVSHAAQYVDDATNDGPLNFDAGERYVRVTSAHKMLDLRNAQKADNPLVWVPFHFLPGNQVPAGNFQGKDLYLRRMSCKPDSDVARAMMEDCIVKQSLPFSLHRFGIALHIYADTWAHQQFVGVVCDFNKVETIEVEPDPAYANNPVYEELTSGTTKAKAFIANHLPVGHAGVLTFPDMPFVKWSFVRENGERVSRDNPGDFVKAANGMLNMVRRYVKRDPSLPAESFLSADEQAIDRLLRTTCEIDGEPRHKVWIDAIAAGAFSFGASSVSYVELGPGSWKYEALGQDPDDETGEETFTFKEEFLQSDWKHFHDAVQYHRLFVLHELLPRFGLCAS